MEQFIESQLHISKIFTSYSRLSFVYKSSVIFGALNLFIDVYSKGLYSNFIMKLIIFLGYGLGAAQILLVNRGDDKSSWNSIVMGEINNLILLYLTYYKFPNYSIIWSQLSICVLFFYHAYLCLTIKDCIFLTAKHAIQWIGTGIYLNKFLIDDFECFIIACLTLVWLIIQATYFDYLKHVDLLKSKYEVKSANDKIASILETLQDIIIVISKEKKELFKNSSCQNFIGKNSLFEILDSYKYLKTYKNPYFDNKTISEDTIKTLDQPINTNIAYGVVTKDREYYEWSGKIINWDDSNVLILCGKNITKIIELEKENKENCYRSVLINTVSHELRTPANAIISVGNLLIQGKELSPSNEEKVKIMVRSCSFQLCLINDLLDYAQIVAGRLKINKVEFSFNELLSECCSYIKHQLAAGVKLETSEENIPDIVMTDPNRLKQVILNLLSNARKFTRKGSVKIESFYLDSKLYISCIDTGIGIPDNKISNLFKDFGKLDDPSCINTQGVGLGLSISNQLVKALGGSGISVNTKENLGSTFTFFIKDERIDSGIAEVGSESPRIRIPTMFVKTIHSRVDILIVDDVYFNILVYIETFKGIGVNCSYAMNGNEAIEFVKKKNFSCILMDCEMPIVDGWEATKILKKMKADRVLKNLPPIIGITSYIDEENLSKCFLVGMDDVIPKPCNNDVLFSKVTYWILKYTQGNH